MQGAPRASMARGFLCFFGVLLCDKSLFLLGLREKLKRVFFEKGVQNLHFGDQPK